MVVLLNCLRLEDTFDDIIKVNVGDKLEDDNNVEIDISDATVSDLKRLFS
ncbi:7623_t:CDS:1, partial [Funneliformis caledonium]